MTPRSEGGPTPTRARWGPALAALALVELRQWPTPTRTTRSLSYNRSMTRFNDDGPAISETVATAYVEVMPTPVRTGVSNFFGNLSDVVVCP